MSKYVPPWTEYNKSYKKFQKQEGIPVHKGIYVEDIRTIEVDHWERTGGYGAFINLLGMEGLCDAHIHEIPEGETLNEQRHLHDQLVFVVNGEGFTTIGQAENQKSFEWSDGSLFYMPRNTNYFHSNANKNDSARLLSVTSLPLLYTFLQNDEAIWENETYNQWEEIKDDGFYSSTAELQTGTDTRTFWESNFVPDAVEFDQLATWSLRGDSNKSVFFPFRDTSMYAHISEFKPGRYKKAHRHLSGANLLILSGEGYSLMWEKGKERTRVDWEPYSLFVPPTMWYHQHFNTSDNPARYLVLHGPIQGSGTRGGDNKATNAIDNPENQIEYHEEDKEIRRIFDSELEKSEVTNKMNDDLYES